MVDTIPAKTQQLIAIFTRKMFSNDVQIGKEISSLRSHLFFFFPPFLAYQVSSFFSSNFSSNLFFFFFAQRHLVNYWILIIIFVHETIHPFLLKLSVSSSFETNHTLRIDFFSVRSSYLATCLLILSVSISHCDYFLSPTIQNLFAISSFKCV